MHCDCAACTWDSCLLGTVVAAPNTFQTTPDSNPVESFGA